MENLYSLLKNVQELTVVQAVEIRIKLKKNTETPRLKIRF